ncbi:MAG TPA: hypothetical protein VF018_16270, partial [Acidobacteriaceae bacterium]
MSMLSCALAVCFSLLATAAVAQPVPNGNASGIVPAGGVPVGGMIDPRGLPGADIGAKVNA